MDSLLNVVDYLLNDFGCVLGDGSFLMLRCPVLYVTVHQECNIWGNTARHTNESSCNRQSGRHENALDHKGIGSLVNIDGLV